MSHAAEPSAASLDNQQGAAGISVADAAPGFMDFVSFTVGDDQHGVGILAARRITGQDLSHSGSTLTSNRKRSPNCDADAR